MKKAFGLLAAFLLFIAAVFVVLAIVPPTGLAQRLLVAGARTATGLDLKISGPMTLRLVPNVALRMENVALTSPEGSPDRPLATARVVEVGTTLLAAISGDRRIDRIALTGANIDLDVGPDGVPKGLRPRPGRAPVASPQPEVAIGLLEINDSTVAYRDAASGVEARLERTEATLRDARIGRFAELVIKAGSAVVREPGKFGRLEVTDLDARIAGYATARAGEATAAGKQARWLDAAGSTTFDATGVTARARGIGAAGADTLGLAAAAANWREPAGRTFAVTSPTAEIASARLDALGTTRIGASSLDWREPVLGAVTASDMALLAASVRFDAMGDVELKSRQLQWSQDGTRIDASGMSGRAASLKAGRAESLTLSATRFSYGDAKRSNGTATAFDDATFATPVLAIGTPIDGTVGFLWNREKVSGKIGLPAPDTLSGARAIPATATLTVGAGELQFTGNLDTGVGTAKGRATAQSANVEQTARWLGIPAPAAFVGPIRVTGDVDAAGTRIAMSNSRVEHAANALTGAFTVDFAGPRPRLSGRIDADRLDVEPYLGLPPVKPHASQVKPATPSKPEVIEPEVSLGDVFKSYMRAMIDAPPTRAGTMEIPALSADQMIPGATRSRPGAAAAWNDDRIDFSALRSFDLDVEWSVRQLDVRGLRFNVPRLRTVVDAGALSLEGRDLGTKDGRISGTARIDAREQVPAIETSFTGTAVDVSAISTALGMTPVIEGDTSVEAVLKSRGSSQKQLVEGLTGTVKTDLPRGSVLGYDLGAINLSTFIRWITGNREYDPERRTPITGLKADLTIEKGVVRDSQVVIGGPLLGVNAEGTIGLVDQRIDYRGRARIASWFNGLPFKIFGDLTKPTFQPDLSLASVFSRTGKGEATLSDIIAGADIKEDAELAFLIGRVLQKAGPSGLDANTAEMLRAVQAKAIGRK